MTGTLEHGQVRTVRDLLAERRAAALLLREAGAIFRSALTQLTQLHTRGEVHGELRPEALVLQPDGSTLLLAPAQVALPPDTAPSYDAPELAAQTPVPDPRADLYSLGVVLWELLSTPCVKVQGRIGTRELRAVRSARFIRQGLIDVLEAMLRSNVTARLQTCEEVWLALDWALDDSTADDSLATQVPIEAPGPALLGPKTSLPALLPWLAAGLAAVLAFSSPGASAGDVDLDSVPPGMPTLEDFGYFLQRLDEDSKSRSLNILADLSSDSRLDPAAVAGVLRALLDEGNPPEGYGYGCGNCFLRRLSGLLGPLRMKGPQVNPPLRGVVVVKLDDGFLGRLSRGSKAEVGGNLTGLVRALLAGYDLVGKFRGDSYVRYHARGGDPLKEPAFFTDAAELSDYEGGLPEPLDAWSLAQHVCAAAPRNRFEPGFLVMEFEPEQACTEVRIPTAGDSENPRFRPTPASEKRAGRTCGGAAEWVCPNIPLTEMKKVRYVPHSSYVSGIGGR